MFQREQFFPLENFSVMELLAKHVPCRRAASLLILLVCWFFWRILGGWKWDQSWPVPSQWHRVAITPKEGVFPAQAVGSGGSMGAFYSSSGWMLTKQVRAPDRFNTHLSLWPHSWGDILASEASKIQTSSFLAKHYWTLVTSQGGSF